MYMKLHFCNDWFETRSSSQTHCDNSCDFFILLNDTIWKNWSIYKYRIIQKMFCVNILGHSIPDLSINIFGSIPAFHWSPLGFAKNGQNGWSFNRYLRLCKIKETFRIWCKLWWEPEDILQASLSSFFVEKRKQSKRKLMHDDSDLACYFPRF